MIQVTAKTSTDIAQQSSVDRDGTAKKAVDNKYLTCSKTNQVGGNLYF